MSKDAPNGSVAHSQAQRDQEQAVGISVFVRPDATPFECIVKQRYTDFLVNEILPNGQVLHLAQEDAVADRKRKRPEDLEKDESSKRPRPAGEEIPAPTTEEVAQNGDVKAEDTTKNGSQGTHLSRDEVKTAKAAAIASINDDDKATLTGIFGQEVADAVLDLYACVVVFPHRKSRDQATVKSEPFTEKSKRTEAHIAIRRIFGANKLESTTAQDGPGYITVKATPPRAPVDPNQEKDGHKKGKIAWAELGGDYLHFTLYKENKDTMEILSFIGSQLKHDKKHFSFAGTKDRRGVTVQRVAVHRIKHERLLGLNRIARGFKLAGPWEYRPEGLELGMLAGNEFLITLRDVNLANGQPDWTVDQRLERAKEVAEQAAKSLGQNGFLNYYGLQRFGTHSIGTHIIGMKMLKGDLRGAVDAILSYNPDLANVDLATRDESTPSGPGSKAMIPRDDINRAKAIHAYRSGGKTNDILNYLPGGRFAAEKSMLTFLAKRDYKTNTRPNETNFQGALLQIQRNLRLMYIHAYQSFVWNTVVGKRWELFGAEVVEGDLVVVGEKERAEGVSTNGAAAIEDVDENGEPIILPTASAASGTQDASRNAASADYTDDPFERARPLTKEEAASGRYTIFDIVLPLPGYDVVYPSNAIGSFYEEFMGSEAGGELDPHNMRRAWKEISLSGGYRKMMARPLGGLVGAEVKIYKGEETQLVQTDLDRLCNGESRTEEGKSMTEEEGDARIALILRLRLGSSQYATMALRELTQGGAMSYRPDFSNSNR